MEWGYVDTFWNLRATITNTIIAYAVLSELEIFTQKRKKNCPQLARISCCSKRKPRTL